MDGLDIVLSKWDVMNNNQRMMVSIIVLGAITVALDAIFTFMIKWIVPAIKQTQNISYEIPPITGASLSAKFLFNIFIIFIFAAITVLAAKRERDLVKRELSQSKEDTQWLLERYFIYKPLADKMKTPGQTGLSAHMNLETISPEEIHAIKIRERTKKINDGF